MRLLALLLVLISVASGDKPNDTYPEGLLLFNLETHIGETTDLAAQHPEIVFKLTQLHDTWRAQMGKPVRGSKPKK